MNLMTLLVLLMLLIRARQIQAWHQIKQGYILINVCFLCNITQTGVV